MKNVSDKEQQYKELERLSQKLHIPMFETRIRLEVFNKSGNLLTHHQQRGHSWVRSFYNWLFASHAGKNLSDVSPNWGDGFLNVKQTDNTIYGGAGPTVQANNDTWDTTARGYRAGAGVDTWGILVGSGLNAESFDDYNLQTQIAEGAAAGQLNHAASEAHDVTWTAGTRTMQNDLVRYFNNNSGGAIDVNELVLVCSCDRPGVVGGEIPVAVSRDKLGVTVTVPDTGQLKVTYSISIVYPA